MIEYDMYILRYHFEWDIIFLNIMSNVGIICNKIYHIIMFIFNLWNEYIYIIMHINIILLYIL